MIRRQKAITELAALPRPWQRIPRSRAKRTASHITRKNPANPSRPITASSRSICVACRGLTVPHRSRAPMYACSRKKLMSLWLAGTAYFGIGGRIHAKSTGSHSDAMRTLSHKPSVRPRHRRSISHGREQPPVAVGMQHAARRRFVDGQLGPQRGEHVVHQAAALVHVPRVVRHHPGHALTLGERDERAGQRRLGTSRVVQLDFYCQLPTEDRRPLAQ